MHADKSYERLVSSSENVEQYSASQEGESAERGKAFLDKEEVHHSEKIKNATNEAVKLFSRGNNLIDIARIFSAIGGSLILCIILAPIGIPLLVIAGGFYIGGEIKKNKAINIKVQEQFKEYNPMNSNALEMLKQIIDKDTNLKQSKKEMLTNVEGFLTDAKITEKVYKKELKKHFNEVLAKRERNRDILMYTKFDLMKGKNNFPAKIHPDLAEEKKQLENKKRELINKIDHSDYSEKSKAQLKKEAEQFLKTLAEFKRRNFKLLVK